MKIIILGSTGFLGSSLFALASSIPDFSVYGTSRFANAHSHILQLDMNNKHQVTQLMNHINPDVVIWSLMDGENEKQLIEIGLHNILTVISPKTKLIYLSTDAVFVDGKGNYSETDLPGFLPSGAPLSTYINAKHIGEDLLLTNHTNHLIIRTGPIYGKDANQEIEARTKRLVHEIKIHGYAHAPANTFKTFVHIDDLSNAIIEIINMNLTGILHFGPIQKESYYSFYGKRLLQLGFATTNLLPFSINKYEKPFHAFDTSLNTKKATSLLRTNFRNVDEPGGIKKIIETNNYESRWK
ncbi:sugar nucleotide-binding protein [Niallia sp. FSL W8-0177]|jgi:dTDP-4-dehydrorhamnose reductase|uniref:sugar nucleotide-binding protein n=1 Tax=Niallia sp. FSL W8-0177 TaxID=2954522 RepID=UPI0030FC47A1